MRTDDEMNEQVNRSVNVSDRVGTKFRGLTYEQGVRDALDWVMGNNDEKPLADDEYAEFDQ